MCGTLKFQNRAAKIGNPIPVFNPVTKQYGEAVFSGHAQVEKEVWWQKKSNCLRIQAFPTEFEEGGHNIVVPKGAYMIGLGLRKTVIINGRKVGPAQSWKILTRPAKSHYEKIVHPRWPVMHYDGKILVFNDHPEDFGKGFISSLAYSGVICE